MASSEYYLSSQQGYKDPAKYYTTGQEPDGRWWNPADMFSLKDGEVIDTESFLSLYRGFSPETGEKLTRNAGLPDRDPGKDLHFAPDKSVSAVWALADPELRSKIEAAHNDAVRHALETVVEEYCAYVRLGANGIKIQPADIMAAMFQHGDSREGDPQLHTHVTLFNFGRYLQENGEGFAYRAHHAGLLYEWKMATGAVYRNALAWKLKTEIGFSIEQYGRDNEFFRINGVSEDLTSLWSKRRHQIVREALKNGYSTFNAPELASNVNKVTRKSKVFETDPEARFDRWHNEADQFINRERFITKLLSEDSSITSEQIEAAYIAVDGIPTQLTRMETVFHLKDVIRAAANNTSGIVDPVEILKISKNVLAQQEVVELPKPKYGWAATEENEQAVAFTTRKEENLEAEIIAYTRMLSKQEGFQLSPSTVRTYLNEQIEEFGIPFSIEQKKLIAVCTIEDTSIVVLDGAAGSGKSFAMRPVAQIYKREGYRVYTTAHAWRQARELGSSCEVTPFSVEKMLRWARTGKIPFDDKTVVIADEWSQLSNRQTHRLMKLAAERGAKVIFLGEEIQDQAVEAGVGPRLVKENLNPRYKAELKTIRRQKADTEDYLVYGEGLDRDTALLRSQMMTSAERNEVYDKYSKAFKGEVWRITASHFFRNANAYRGLKEYGKRQKVHFVSEHETRLKMIVNDWLGYHRETGKVATILARTNAEIAEISDYAREALLPEPSKRVEYELRVSSATNTRPTTKTLYIAVGDVLKFGTLMHGMQLDNGSIVRVTHLEERRHPDGRDRLHITATASGGREVQFFAEDVKDIFGDIRLDYGYARTMSSAQGMTEDKIFVYADEFLARETSYPAFTRHSIDLEIYFNRKALSMVVRERLPEDQYDRVITDEDLYKYLGQMHSRDGKKVNALDLYDYIDAEGHDYRIERDKLVKEAEERIANSREVLTQLPEISYPRQLRLQGIPERVHVDNELVTQAVSDLTRFSSAFSKNDARVWFARNGVHHEDLDAFYHALSCHSNVVPMRDETRGVNPKFSATHVLAEERRVIEVADLLMQRVRHTKNRSLEKMVDAIAQTHGLDAGRADFIKSVFKGTGLSLMRGQDDAEKSLVLRGLGEYARKRGERIFSLGVTQGDLAQMKELPGRKSVAEGFLYGIGRGKEMADVNDIVILNGAEKLDNTSMAALLEAANRRGFKLVMMGNDASVHAYGRSGAFAHLADYHGASGATIEPVKFTALEEHEKLLVTRDYDGLIRHLERNSNIHFPVDETRVASRLANVLDTAAPDELAIVAKTALERHNLNANIQEIRREAGQIGEGIELFVGVERSGPIDGVDRYFAPDDTKQKYFQTHRIAVHVGDVLIMRATNRDQGVYNGMVGHVTSVSQDKIDFETSVDGARRTGSINPREFRSFDLGYARSPMDIQKHTPKEVHAVLSRTWQHSDLHALWNGQTDKVQLYSPSVYAPDAKTLAERLNSARQHGFVGADLTRMEERRLGQTDSKYHDHRLDSLNDIEKGFVDRLDKQREENITLSKEEMNNLYETGVRHSFTNDNKPVLSGYERFVANLKENWANERVDVVASLHAGMRQHVQELKVCREWSSTNQGTLYEAPAANSMISNLRDMEAKIRMIEAKPEEYHEKLAQLHITDEQMDAVKQTLRDYVAGQRVHRIEEFQSAREEATRFARISRQAIAEFDQLKGDGPADRIWRSREYIAAHNTASAAAGLGRQIEANFDKYKQHLPETGITRKSMVDSLISQLDGHTDYQLRTLDRKKDSSDPVEAVEAIDKLRTLAHQKNDVSALNDLASLAHEKVEKTYFSGRFGEIDHLKTFDDFATKEQRRDRRAYNGDPFVDPSNSRSFRENDRSQDRNMQNEQKVHRDRDMSS